MDRRIIIIDDQVDVRNSFKLALEDTGILVDSASSGEEGLEMIKKNNYDLIYLDLKMPGIDGVETLLAIRNIYPDIPVYIITAFLADFMSGLKRLQNEGYEFELVKKPLEMSDIKNVTCSIIDGKIRC
jgi:CheY-like chemotaxis protein